ncbi:MAG TPA: transketolase [Gemmatimonadales bacterium]|nr:transketolase [Gemmatimonadales bacterium]
MAHLDTFVRHFHRAPATVSTALDLLCINSLRVLAMDAVQQADSGHPGTPMALAPLAYLLYTRHLRHDPAHPEWPGRDRLVLSCGHASMLLYGALHLSGYALSLEDLRAFRQWESRTPGHPERGLTPGVETTTGPLGQGLGNAVGMAIARGHLAARFNRPGHAVVGHRIYFIASDGDLMEGISHEAASLAGHLRVTNLIGFFDDNRITIDGPTSLSCSDDVRRRFEAYGWRVLDVGDVNDLEALDRAISQAQAVSDRPVMIVVRSHIGFGSPHKQDTAEAHGAPLGADEVRLTKANLGWTNPEPFYQPAEAVAEWRKCLERGAGLHAEWRATWSAYRETYPDQAQELERRLAGELPAGWEASIPNLANDAVATRAASGKVINALAGVLPELMGGSADLAGSNNTTIKGATTLAAGAPDGRNLCFGIREHGMGAILNGLALHGGVLPYGGTFLVFSDYMRPAIRLAALTGLHVIYVFTHDSIGLGEDGPTHQPVEHLSALRAIPNLVVIRPADAAETAQAWRAAVRHRGGPVALVLTRQKVPALPRARPDGAADLARGAYVLADATPCRAVLMASGSEVSIVLDAQRALAAEGVAARVVSMPSHELFAAQPAAYRDQILPPEVTARVAVEAAHPMSWARWVGSRGAVVGLERFGASAPYQRIYQELGITADHVAAAARRLLA